MTQFLFLAIDEKGIFNIITHNFNYRADIEASQPQCEKCPPTVKMLTVAGNRGPMVVMTKGVNDVISQI